MSLPPEAPTIRLCHLTKWNDFNGYGFNLHTDKVKNIQTLGEIDKGSPAEAAGLMKGDRIVEVNGQNVFNENHRQVVERIKAVAHETRLLVVDPLSDQWYRERNIVIHGSLPSVRVLTSAKEQQQALHRQQQRNATKMTNGGSGAVIPSDAPSPRLCHLRKWADFEGYGFNLHADKAKRTQFVGVVDLNSPAESAGMKRNDKIIEVNGENVENLTHREIVDRVKAVPNETTLLVVDDATYKYYFDRGIQISSSLKNVLRLETPSTNPLNKNNSAAPTKTNHLVPRLCLLRKWQDYDGYGFNLHADKTNNLHYIGEVDEGSPAKLGGLQPGDRLVEVNGTNIDNIAHREIIERIKSNPNQTELLVVCKETDRLYREKQQVPRHDMREVRHLATPARDAEHMEEHDGSSKSSSPKMLPSTPSSNRSEELSPSSNADDYNVTELSPTPSNNAEPPAYSETRNGRGSAEAAASSPEPLTEAEGQSNQDLSDRMANSTLNGDNNPRADMGGDVSPIFSMKASDVREMLKQRKKKDPRGQNMDLMQKFKIMEQL
ncbi:Na(+)/H(+) exchange regulatory cofactor NHE-RF2-like [Varroa jacobsoni]|uniref:PDZ domain-containing protein n=1 Tax=Varroa destructor TaxID=109461 RepID=A0A7M7JDE2_VARDE|nr:Na(+)/H(+) exchange regulatory cofactor NHE-RF2-like isoform X2 [Varroa destructor]XP_022705163.1 Na(+)/H(+) exchange regulatory cofactor NHE-RF2-like [Varroa jacobsoni]